ncbi:MAG: DUF3383 family protein [Acutalibacteraceae bacterium]|nr:DUF3383 family protein [Acutalibacteraceae bacterium]
MVDIVNIINVSEQTPTRTLGFYNVNNVMVFTDETPVADFGTDTFRAYTNLSDAVTDWGTDSDVAGVVKAMLSQSPSLLAGGGQVLVAPYNQDSESTETLDEAIVRMSAEVYFGGVISAQPVDSSEASAVASVCQTLETIWVYPQSDTTALTGIFKTLIDAGYSHTKCFLYTLGDEESVLAAASYISRGFAVDFNAQNSCLTMNLKDLAGVDVDTGISQTVYNSCKSLGVDCYCGIEGLPKVISNAPAGGLYFDQLFNRMWFRQTARVQYFNTLAGTPTKIPQTEAGMNSVKNALRSLCDLAVYNGFLAAGKWNGADKFGDEEDFMRNISDFGYYIYSRPVAEQLQTDRVARKAPVIQIAGKEAGAIHSGSLILSFEA